MWNQCLFLFSIWMSCIQNMRIYYSTRTRGSIAVLGLLNKLWSIHHWLECKRNETFVWKIAKSISFILLFIFHEKKWWQNRSARSKTIILLFQKIEIQIKLFDVKMIKSIHPPLDGSLKSSSTWAESRWRYHHLTKQKLTNYANYYLIKLSYS